MTLTVGSWADLDNQVGVIQPSGRGPTPVTEELVRRFLEVLEWDYPLVVDGRRQAIPASASFIFGVPPYWQPGDPPRPLGSPLHARLPFLTIPSPGTRAIGVTYTQESLGPIYIGQTLECSYRVLGYRKATTRIGKGAFIEIEASYRNEDDRELVRGTWVIFRYTPGDEQSDEATSEARPAAKAPDAAPLHEVEIGHDLQRMVMWAGANYDFAPLHFDRDFAQSAGAPNAFANTIFVLAFYERLLHEALGGNARISKIGPFRMTEFTPCDTVLRASVWRMPDAGLDGETQFTIRQESDGVLTSYGTAIATEEK